VPELIVDHLEQMLNVNNPQAVVMNILDYGIKVCPTSGLVKNIKIIERYVSR